MATAIRELESSAHGAISAPVRDTMRALEILLAPLGRRDFAVRLWDGTTMPPEPRLPARFTLVLNHPGALRRMIWPPGELAAAEAFIRNDFDIEGDLFYALSRRDAFHLGAREAVALLPLAPSLLRTGAGQETVAHANAHLDGHKHSVGRDAAAVRYHYDTGNDFYALWLDRRMVYSCAYFPTADLTIDAAQEAKLELICRKLDLRPGDRLLDIGCGWGGLVAYAAERHGAHAVGITLSEAQAELARRRIAALGLSDRCRIELADYRELKAEPFDRIASVGMIEHVGLAQLAPYFRHAHDLLRPGGLFLNHGIAPLAPRDDSLRSKVLRHGGFLQRYVFPDYELPFLHERAQAAHEAGFELRDVDSLREHYALTLRHWVGRLEKRREDAVRVADETTYRIWRLYMAGAAADFDRGQNTVYQELYVRPDHGRSGLPLSRAGWYASPLPSGSRRQTARGVAARPKGAPRRDGVRRRSRAR